MSRKKTTAEFIERAKEIHGVKYDYSLAQYKDAHANVKIVCKEHGIFEQSATNHVSGYGCPNASHRSERTKSTIEDFIKRANLTHHNYYDYKLVVWHGMAAKIDIICPEHGVFTQIADKHIQGSGCQDYSHRKFDKISKEEFIQRAKLVHGDLYDYSLSNFHSIIDKVQITCRQHGMYWQIAADHCGGHGCQKCGNVYVRTTQEFIDDAILIHGDRYGYHLVKVVSGKLPVSIVCHIHGEFQQPPSQHLTGYGCIICGVDSKKYSLDEFISLATTKHNGKYDYRLVQYINGNTKVSILCPNHGQFDQRPAGHLFGYGCPKCAHTISKMEMAWLNELSVPEEFRQSSLVLNGKALKVDAYNPSTNTVYEFYGDYWHGNPKLFDHNKMHPDIKGRTFGEVYERTIHRESQLVEAGYVVVSVWEHDYKQARRKTI